MARQDWNSEDTPDLDSLLAAQPARDVGSSEQRRCGLTTAELPSGGSASWPAVALCAIALAAIIAAMFGSLILAPAILFVSLATLRFIAPKEATATFMTWALGAGLFAMAAGSVHARRSLEEVAYKAYLAELGCENVDMFGTSNGRRHAPAGPPSRAELKRCENKSNPFQFHLELEARGWPTTFD